MKRSAKHHNENKIDIVAKILATNAFLLLNQIKKLNKRDTIIAGM
jgi:hypothetical protein